MAEFLEKTGELVESAKETAHATSVKAQELEQAAEEKLHDVEKKGKRSKTTWDMF